MQNHLIQILALVAMEPPVSMRAEDVRDEKAKVLDSYPPSLYFVKRYFFFLLQLLRAVPPVTLDNLVIGQYGPGEKESAYLDDPTVPKGSITPTYAAAILFINNSRWKGITPHLFPS